MKKIITIILTLALCLIPLTGCNNSLGKIKLSGNQDTDYVVYNNGSNAVQYGNYLYFVNGTRGYDDTDAKNNVWGKVTKGGLYRVELNGTKNERNFTLEQNVLKDGTETIYETGHYFKSYSPYVTDSNDDRRYLDGEENKDFIELVRNDSLTLTVTKTETDEDGKETEEETEETFTMEDLQYEVKNVERFAPKTIGTSGYSSGGIFIFDNYCYYASPNNERNKTGSIQTSLTDFFVSSLDGKATYKVYTSSSDTSSSPYAFYKYGDSVYLTVLDGTNVVSVRIKNGKKKQASVIAENITGAYMPVNKVYDSLNHNENDITEFIFTTRTSTEDEDGVENNTIIECMRPDGTSRNKIFNSKTSVSVEDVKDGLLYYKEGSSIRYTNLNSVIGSSEEFSGELIADASAYTDFYFIRGLQDSTLSDIFIIAKASDGLYVINDGARNHISNVSGTVIGFYENMVYFYNGASLMRCNIALTADDNTDETLYSNLSNSGLAPSVVNGLVVFNGNYTSDITDYARIYFIDGGSSFFAGEIADFDLPAEEE